MRRRTIHILKGAGPPRLMSSEPVVAQLPLPRSCTGTGPFTW